MKKATNDFLTLNASDSDVLLVGAAPEIVMTAPGPELAELG